MSVLVLARKDSLNHQETMKKNGVHHVFTVVLILLLFVVITAVYCIDEFTNADMLASTPYLNRPHGVSTSLSEIRRLLDDEVFEITEMASEGETEAKANVEFLNLVDTYAGKMINGHYLRLHNPRKHFSVVQPKVGCDAENDVDSRTRVVDTVTALKSQTESDPNYRIFSGKNVTCIAATNAGFFDVNNGHCYGNVVSNGHTVQSSELHNINFATTKNGRYMIGYLGNVKHANQLLKEKTNDQKDEIINMIGGVIWLVRNGKPYVSQSQAIEDMNTQKSGSTFVTLRASRIALGHDKHGKIVVLEMDGDGRIDKGLTLYELAILLVKLGVQNAINLDGGGSATIVKGFRGSTDTVSHTVVNAVSDGCGAFFKEEGNSFKPVISLTSVVNSDVDALFRCDRSVTTITCMHDSLDQPAPNAQEFNKEFCTEEYNRLFQVGILLASGVSLIGLLNIVFLLIACIYSRFQNGNKRPRESILNITEFDSDEDTQGNSFTLSETDDRSDFEPNQVELKQTL